LPGSSHAHIGDPTLDLSWLLNHAPTTMAEGVAAAYGVTPELRQRALDWHRLGPWHEVWHGLVTRQLRAFDAEGKPVQLQK
jgi:hypothetical protein